MTDLVPLELNPELDIAELGARFRRDGHVRVRRVFTRGAPELYHYLEENEDWIQVINHEGGAHEVAWNDWRKRSGRSRRELEPEMFARAVDEFQYCYAALRVPALGEHEEDPVLLALRELMRGKPMQAMLEGITGLSAPAFTDGQVTAYGEGDFLTGHDDDLANSGRKVAFVLGLTPQWRLEWGGLLLFHEIGGIDCAGLVPQFNTLDLFAIPRYHSVSMVTRAAPRRRFSVTGWLSVPEPAAG